MKILIEKLSLQYAIRLAANPSNPAHEVTFPPNYVDLYEQKPTAIKSFGIRISPLLESANIKPQNIEKHFTPNIPAWCMKPLEILFDLHSGGKSESNPHILKDDFRKMQSRYKNYQQIYADGSKEVSKVAKTQRLVLLLYQTAIVICNVYLTIHLFSLLKPKQLI